MNLLALRQLINLSDNRKIHLQKTMVIMQD